MIVVQNISYVYPSGKKALANISFKARTGSLVGIVGPNGSGKTTLIGCISGYYKPCCGQVLVDGENSTKMSAKEAAKRIALVRQQNTIEYGFTVGDIVLMGRNPHLKRWHGEQKGDFEAANKALYETGIYDLKHRYAGTLSGGEKQMMVLARALCQQAGTMLLDEPVSGLDVSHQISIMKTVRHLVKNRNLTAVCVLHDLNLAHCFCDSVVMLNEGGLFTFGSPKQVLTKNNIEQVYKTPVCTIEHKGRTFVIPDIY